MDTTTVDALVADYLRRLEAAAYRLPADRRGELLAEISEHIAAARASGSGAEAEVRTLLDRLGDPDEIVAAASDGEPAEEVAFTTRPPSVALEIAAVLFLTVGSLLLVVGWLVGVVLLWSSRRWTTGEKLLGTLVVPLGPFGVLILGGLIGGQQCVTTTTSSGPATPLGGTEEAGLQTTEVCSGFALPPWLGIPVLLVAVVGPFVVAGLLVRRARARAALEPPVVRRTTGGGTGRVWGGLEIAAVALLGVGWLVVPIVGPVAGLACAWASAAWTSREKWVATAIAGGGLLLPVIVLVAGVALARGGGVG